MGSGLQELKSKHRLMMEDLELAGLTQSEVCVKHDITPGRLSIIVRSPLWVIEAEELRAERKLWARKRMESLVPKSINTLEANLDCGNAPAEISAAKAILNRAGMPENLVITEEPSDKLSDMYSTLQEIQNAKKVLKSELGLKEDEYAEELGALCEEGIEDSQAMEEGTG